MLTVKRVYDPPAIEDGFRVLVDRLWPRGLSKEHAAIDIWLKDIAPTDELRKSFGHDPEKFSEFRKQYETELENNPAVQTLRQILKDHSTVTLLYGAKDTAHNQAVVLRDFLERVSG